MTLVSEQFRLVEPLSVDEPCGPDLDAEGDLDFLNRVAHAEGLLPASYFSFPRREDGSEIDGPPTPFDRSTIDFRRETKALADLLGRTRDLRVLVLLARLSALDRDVQGLADVLAAIARLLEEYWEAVHPRGEGGDYELRGAVLQSLEDMATVVLPLQYTPLVQSRRYGSICFRSLMVADNEVSAREGEPVLDRATILRAFEEADPETLRPQREAFAVVAEAINRIRVVTIERGGHGAAVSLDRLGELVGRIRNLIHGERGASASAEPEMGGAAAPEAAIPAVHPPTPAARSIATAEQAAAALGAAAAYLRNYEPSSPAELLTRQALMLVGKPFVEVMRILMPSRASDALIAIGAGRSLHLTFDQLAAVSEVTTDGEPDLGESPEGTEEALLAYRAANRLEALALLREAGAYFRSHEPTSPIPLIIDRALSLADRDFMAIMRDVLPDIFSE